MPLKSIPVGELRRLLDAVSSHSSQHLIEVEADLVQTTLLLSEAIEKLGVSFMAVHAAVTTQQQVLEAWISRHGDRVGDSDAEELNMLKQKIGDEVSAVVTGLQFQDMTSQLIARTIKRVNGLKGLLEELASHGDEIDPQQGEERKEIAKFLEEMNKSLNARSDALSGGLRRSVSQDNMGSGEIELF